MYESATDRCIKKMREMDAALQQGEEIYREERSRELSVVWNCSDFREWRIGYNVLRAVSRERETDPRAIWVIVFITGPFNAAQILKEIGRLENLKAFW